MIHSKEAFSGFSVDNVQKAKQFYSTVLGLSVDDGDMGLRLHLPGGATVFVYEKDNHEPASFTILNFVVEDIDAAVDELTAQGINLEQYDDMGQDKRGILRGRATHKGPDIAWFKDPAGNILAVLQESSGYVFPARYAHEYVGALSADYRQ